MGEMLDMRALGVHVELLRTDPDVIEFDVVGRARGVIAQGHVHTDQVERHEVVEGAMELRMGGERHVLRAGDVMEVPAGVAHAQRPGAPGAGRVRVSTRPPGDTEAFLRRLAELCATGQINRFGFPRPRAAVALLRDFAHTGRPALLPVADLWRPYVFADEWDVTAPQEAVFDAISDGRTYPEWWRPVYIAVDAEGPPAVGKQSAQHFKGRLPYHLRTRSTVVAMERPHTITGDVDGDLRGRGVWTLTPSAVGTHVRFDWEVHADRRLLKVLTPVLRPLFRWNHAWAIARAVEGLEPYAQRMAARERVGA